MGVRVHRAENRAIVCIIGRFDFSQHGEFRACTQEGLGMSGIRGVDVDLSESAFLDSSALGMLLVLLEKCEQAGLGKPRLIGAKGMVKQVLDIANFERMFDIC